MFSMTQQEIFKTNLLSIGILFIVFIFIKIKEERSMFSINFSGFFSIYIVPFLIFCLNGLLFLFNKDIVCLIFMCLLIIPVQNILIDVRNTSKIKQFLKKIILKYLKY